MSQPTPKPVELPGNSLAYTVTSRVMSDGPRFDRARVGPAVTLGGSWLRSEWESANFPYEQTRPQELLQRTSSASHGMEPQSLILRVPVTAPWATHCGERSEAFVCRIFITS